MATERRSWRTSTPGVGSAENVSIFSVRCEGSRRTSRRVTSARKCRAALKARQSVRTAPTCHRPTPSRPCHPAPGARASTRAASRYARIGAARGAAARPATAVLRVCLLIAPPRRAASPLTAPMHAHVRCAHAVPRAEVLGDGVARRVAHATQFPFLSASQPALQLCSGVCSDGAAHRGLCHPDRTVLPLEVKFGADSFNTLILMISACVGLVSPSDPTLQCSLPHCEGPPPRHASPRPRVPSSRRVCPTLLWVPQRRHFAAATVR